ncbi:SsrA-binding protein [Candidatus Peribacteria bacterium RIFCSPHIGHO2_02_FULL_49_16]|nr:MAG: SsrA-binding protein [Candidatus Peribacteria bacterium RIFCSPHIGHO2_01_FULL_49_38]OGJ60148.1 MAG: SsrA-binding protein [Candidatus Peribacteria bacterium RIFCSPHIGHO2_02_FULL_49_16]
MVSIVVAKNRRARHDYDILETIEAGMQLTGQEVKSCRIGGMNLSGAYVSFVSGQPVLKEAKIAPYRYASGLEGYSPSRDRSLLLKKVERVHLEEAAKQKGFTIIPLEVRAGAYIKILLGMGRGQKKYDKRQKKKEKSIERKLRRGEEI